MPIHRLLQKKMSSEPEEVSRLTTAYEQALRGIGLVDRDDPLSEMVAKKVIEVAKRGDVILNDLLTRFHARLCLVR